MLATDEEGVFFDGYYEWITYKYSVGDYIDDFKLKNKIEDCGTEVETNVIVSTATKTTYSMKFGDCVMLISSEEGSGTMIEEIEKI